jgi:sugar phosphate isomerase/epimerase
MAMYFRPIDWSRGFSMNNRGVCGVVSRRDFLASSIGLPFALRSMAQGIPRQDSVPKTIGGLHFGVETFSFHDVPQGDPKLLPVILRNMRQAGIPECEIMSGHIEPFPNIATGWWVQTRTSPDFPKLREAAREWRLTVPMDYYTNIRKQFEAAGLRIYYYNINFNETFTDAERDRTFEAAKALGAEAISSSTVLSEAQRLITFAERHKYVVAMHNHNNLVDPDQFATPASFEKALAMSPYFMCTLDTGHFTAGNNDALAFLKQHHDRITNVHLRDRKRNNGPNRPFGQGDTPLREILLTIRDNKWPIRCYIEYEYGSFRSSEDEVKSCMEYCRNVVLS